MIKSSNIAFSSVPHLLPRSTWELTQRSFARLKGPRALGAILSLTLAGVLSVYTCLRSGWARSVAAHAGEPPVLLLTHTPI